MDFHQVLVLDLDTRSKVPEKMSPRNSQADVAQRILKMHVINTHVTQKSRRWEKTNIFDNIWWVKTNSFVNIRSTMAQLLTRFNKKSQL